MEESGLNSQTKDPSGAPQDVAIRTGIESAAGIVTLDRPSALNALTTAMRAEIAAAFAADRARRTEAERSQITEAFTSVTDPDMSRSMVTRSRIFKLAPPK